APFRFGPVPGPSYGGHPPAVRPVRGIAPMVATRRPEKKRKRLLLAGNRVCRIPTDNLSGKARGSCQEFPVARTITVFITVMDVRPSDTPPDRSLRFPLSSTLFGLVVGAGDCPLS